MVTHRSVSVSTDAGPHVWSLSRPGDAYERQAARIAARVARGETVTVLPDLPDSDLGPGLRGPRTTGPGHALTSHCLGDPDVRWQGTSARTPGRPISSVDRVFLERAFGTDFRDVRLHTGPEADELCRRLGAAACTEGRDIFVRAGHYRPGTREGRLLLAHELTHVCQRRTGTMQRYLLVRDVEETLAGLTRRVKDQGSLYDDAIAAQMTTSESSNFLNAYIISPVRHYHADVYKALRLEIDTRTFAPTVDISVPDVQLAVSELEADIDQQLVYEVTDAELDVHPGSQILFRLAAKLLVNRSSTSSWTIGFTQTVLASHKEAFFKCADERVRKVDMQLPQACLDRRPDATEPWYDNFFSSVALQPGMNDVTALLDDKPGFTLGKEESEDYFIASGSDSFKTWLILRRDDGWVRYIYEWAWNVDYDSGKASLTDQKWLPSGDDAKLTGARASEALIVAESYQ